MPGWSPSATNAPSRSGGSAAIPARSDALISSPSGGTTRTASPWSACASVVQISGPSLGRKYELQGGEVAIGRDEACAIVVELDTVSRRHCTLLIRPDGAFVRDDGSKNGSFINGLRVGGEAPLRSGDLI